MPRLPVGDPEPPAPVVSLSWRGLAFGLGALALWILGDLWLASQLGVDIACGERAGRRAALGEMIACAGSEGPRGWLVLALFAVPFVAIGWWMRSKLRRARGHVERADESPCD